MAPIYHGILFSHKKNEILPFATPWIELEIIVLNELSQAQKDKYHMISDLDFKKLTLRKLRVEWWLPEARQSIGEGQMGRDY
jgi:hypothetical protein